VRSEQLLSSVVYFVEDFTRKWSGEHDVMTVLGLSGSDLVNWLQTHVEGFVERRDARRYACELLRNGYIRHTVNKSSFSEQCYYTIAAICTGNDVILMMMLLFSRSMTCLYLHDMPHAYASAEECIYYILIQCGRMPVICHVVLQWLTMPQVTMQCTRGSHS